jgi:protein-tyrosine phosphatase
VAVSLDVRKNVVGVPDLGHTSVTTGELTQRGERLRRRRLQRGLTLADAAAELEIPAKSLRAIEWDRGDLLETPGDANRIEQQYAAFLGLRPQERFELVLICTGNRARSPVAEGFLRHLLADLPVHVHSLGTLDVAGAPALGEAVKAASHHGLDISAHRARTLRGEDLRKVDLVLGFEQHHVDAAVTDGGARPERVFTLSELVELIEEHGAASQQNPIDLARQQIADAHARRLGKDSATPIELADPLGQSGKVFRDTVGQVRDLSVQLAVGLFGEGAVRS